MKIINVTVGWTTHTQFISDDAKADAAYDALKAAMDTYDKFGNDKAKSVTVDTGSGCATYRIEALSAVSMDACAGAEADVIEREVWKRALEAKIAARLAPAAS